MADADRPAHAKITVLTVDDASAIQKLTKLMLELEPDIEVVGQGFNGLEGVELAALHQPDVVLLDIAMPEMDGLEALPLIRERSPASRVLMVTGFGTDDIRARAAQLGAVGFIDKWTIAGAMVQAVRGAVEAQEAS